VATLSQAQEHAQFDIMDTVLVKVLPSKAKKEVGFRESRAGMFASTSNLARSGFIGRKEENRSRHTSKRIDLRTCNFSIC
jgi:ribosomal protein S4E